MIRQILCLFAAKYLWAIEKKVCRGGEKTPSVYLFASLKGEQKREGKKEKKKRCESKRTLHSPWRLLHGLRWLVAWHVTCRCERTSSSVVPWYPRRISSRRGALGGGRGEFAGRTIGARLDSRWRDAIAHHYHERPRGYQHHRKRRVLATVVAVVVAVALVSATLLSLAPPYSSGV